MSKRPGGDAAERGRKRRAPRRAAAAAATPARDRETQPSNRAPKPPRAPRAPKFLTNLAPRGGPRFARKMTTGSVVGWTALSVIVPGAAHLRAGRRRTGFVLLGLFGLLLLVGLVYGLSFLGNLGAMARESTMITISAAAVIGALCWFALVLTSYVALGPDRLNGRGQIVSGIVVGLLCVSVMAPFALAANTVLTLRDTVKSIFRSASDPDIQPIKEADPWNGKKRVNFLLIGGDAAGNRTGVRTDSMTVASVDIKTGNTVLFSLPRNLQHVRFPPSSPLAKHFPNGFMAELPNGGLLNEVWQYANDNPQIMGGKNKGPRALMDAIGHTLGLRIDYYALINMYGFVGLVDAIGGIRLRVEKDIPWGGTYGTAGTIKAGLQRLSGEEALWYGRSRVVDDDFGRMGRQRCVIGAFAQQATPDKILTNFGQIARTAKRMAQTNIPQELLEPLANLALEVKDARITSLQFVPPQFYTGSPDWPKIRRATLKAINDSLKPAKRALAAGVTASPGATTSPAATATPSAGRTVTPSQTPTRNGQSAANNGSAKSLSELCGL
ncbi:LCP family protein [Nonomuraea africana]|uniref:LCP family protein required for cell wall assembly n=1 Tax=Nonomuraea africana TaxID=46171 RepID=A0ABR9KAJ9_9ACTN|nr:LCP family protein [Nonomuraea africana]MBE1558925.1 LCP family protein required for cell wall assembly [Nonomuraea africana]